MLIILHSSLSFSVHFLCLCMSVSVCCCVLLRVGVRGLCGVCVVCMWWWCVVVVVVCVVCSVQCVVCSVQCARLVFHLIFRVAFSYLSSFISSSLSFSVHFLCRCVCCCVLVCVWCEWCVCGVCGGGVWWWCVARLGTQKTNLRVQIQNVPVCTGTTRTFVLPHAGRGAGTHGDVLNLHTEVFGRTHGGEGGKRRERGGGSPSVLLTMRRPT